jgi:hypothetical protein
MIRFCATLAFLMLMLLPRHGQAYVVHFVCDDRPIERSTLISLFETQALGGGDPTGEYEEAITAFNRNPTSPAACRGGASLTI